MSTLSAQVAKAFRFSREDRAKLRGHGLAARDIAELERRLAAIRAQSLLPRPQPWNRRRAEHKQLLESLEALRELKVDPVLAGPPEPLLDSRFFRQVDLLLAFFKGPSKSLPQRRINKQLMLNREGQRAATERAFLSVMGGAHLRSGGKGAVEILRVVYQAFLSLPVGDDEDIRRRLMEARQRFRAEQTFRAGLVDDYQRLLDEPLDPAAAIQLDDTEIGEACPYDCGFHSTNESELRLHVVVAHERANSWSAGARKPAGSASTRAYRRPSRR
jgi:hypothetical protein